MFHIQEEISRSIASALQINLSDSQPSRQVRPQTRNLDAYNLYLQGRHEWYRRTEAGIRNAGDYFQRAVQLDTQYARAYAGLADVYVQLDGWEFVQPHEAMPKDKEFVNKALAFDPALAEAYVSRGAINETYDWDPEAAGRDYARAAALDPAYITGRWWYGAWLDAAGRRTEAREQWERALQLDPLSVPVLIDAAVYHYNANVDYDTALKLCQKAIDPIRRTRCHIVTERSYWSP